MGNLSFLIVMFNFLTIQVKLCLLIALLIKLCSTVSTTHLGTEFVLSFMRNTESNDNMPWFNIILYISGEESGEGKSMLNYSI